MASNCGLPEMAASRSTTCSRSAPSSCHVARHRRGIAAVDGLLLELALLEAHDLAPAHVDGGHDDHAGLLAATASGTRTCRTKFAIRRRPTAWLFSGWNCTPRTLPRPTMAGKSRAVVGARQHDLRPARRRSTSGRSRRALRRPRRRAADGAARRWSGSSPCAGTGSSPSRRRTRPGRRPRPAVAAVLLALLEQELHADADAEQGASLVDRLPQHGHQPAALDLVHGRAERAVAGQDQRVRPPQLRGVAAEDRRARPRGGSAFITLPRLPMP